MDLYQDLRHDADGEQRSLVTRQQEGSRVTLTMSDPERLNALSPALNVQLQRQLEKIVNDPEIRSVILTGSDPAFSAGGDLQMIRDGNKAVRDGRDPADTSDAWRWIRTQFGGVVRAIATSDKLFVAAINGTAAGVGLAFALSCDVLVASERAVLVPAFGKLGLVPEVGTSWLLTRRLGYHGALAYYLSGRHLSAENALEMGLVQELARHEDLLATAGSWCERAERIPDHVVAMSKTLLRAAADSPWEQTLRLEDFAEANCFSTEALGRAADGLLARRPERGGRK